MQTAMNERVSLMSEPRAILWGMDTDSVRLVYRSSRAPTLLLLLCAIVCGWLVKDITNLAGLLVWVLFAAGLTVVSLFVEKAFERSSSKEQSAPLWRYVLMAGACASGIALSSFAVLFIPAEEFAQQLLLLGLLSLVAASTSIAFAVNLLLFTLYVTFAFVPIVWVYLTEGSEVLRSLGLLVLTCLAAITVAVIQVNRLLSQSAMHQARRQELIKNLQAAQHKSDALNAKLTQEIAHKQVAEQQLLSVQAGLERSVNERTAELKETLQSLEKAQERLELALDASQLALWDWNLVTDEIHHTRVKNIFGLEESDVHDVLNDLRPLLHPEDLPVLRAAMVEHMKQRTKSYVVEYRIRHNDGHWVWIEDRGRAVERDAAGRVLRMLGTRRDITLNKQRDEKLRLASSVFDAGTESIIIVDPQYHILAVNKAYSAVTQYTQREVLGQPIIHESLPDDIRQHYQVIRQSIEQHGSWHGETLGVRKNGEIFPKSLKIHTVRDEDNTLTHIVGFFSDLTARRETEERLNYLAQYDELTELSNRALFQQRLQLAVERAVHADGCIALLHIDLDRFKVLNDSLGFEAADQVLRRVSRRLTRLLPNADTLARLGGNEFAVIIDDCEVTAQLEQLAASVLAEIRRPIAVADDDEEELVISASLGISMMSADVREPATLITQAGMAMQHAKHLGGDNVQFYSSHLQSSSLSSLQLEQQLRRAIEEEQLEPYYQPKMTLADGSIRSAEVLVRWNHPQRGLVPPGEFIGLAEETGLIAAISELMLLKACQQALHWLEQGMPIRVSVNISVSHIRQGNLVALVEKVLQETGLPAYLLELELTETQMLENAECNMAIFTQLSELGVHLAIDDFGTGYSSLSYLKRFPVKTLKIDQSFINDVVHDDEDAAITRAIIAMAHSLNLNVIAEGVETQEQLDFLIANDCDEVQGYLICRPIPAEQFTEFLKSHKQAQSELSLS